MSLNGTPRLWSEDDRTKVAGLLQDGASASEVGHAMNLTRNAAIGRIARDPDLHRLMRHPNPPRPGSYVPLHHSMKRAAPSLPPPEPPRPISNPMPLVETGSRFCKWPIGYDVAVDGFHICCGAPVAAVGEVYCAPHRKKSRPV